MTSLFLTHVKEAMWTKRYAKRTIVSYLYWIKAFINFNDKKHPCYCHDTEVELFLNYLSNQLNVAPKTQALALNSLSFLYKNILNTPLTLDLNFNKSHIQQKLPVVLTQGEITQLLEEMNTNYALIGKLLYGSGLRLMEAVRLRIQDIDFDYLTVRVWQGKGAKNRCVTLAKEIIKPLKLQIGAAKLLFEHDRKNKGVSRCLFTLCFSKKISKSTNRIWLALFVSFKKLKYRSRSKCT